MVVCDVSDGKLIYHDFKDSIEAHEFAARLKKFYDGLPRKYGSWLTGNQGRKAEISELVSIKFEWEMVNNQFSIVVNSKYGWLPKKTANSIRDDFVEQFPAEYRTI